jgi:hypothetical protein
MAKMGLLVSSNHGFDNEEVIEQLDSVVADIEDATERDRAASTALINAYRRPSDKRELQKARVDATREPLAAAHLLIELLALLQKNSGSVAPSVASDFYGGAELIRAAFRRCGKTVCHIAGTTGVTIGLPPTVQSQDATLLFCLCSDIPGQGGSSPMTKEPFSFRRVRPSRRLSPASANVQSPSLKYLSLDKHPVMTGKGPQDELRFAGP